MEPVIRKVADIEPVRSLCGFRQRLIDKTDGFAAGITYLTVNEAECHYHNETQEFYYCLEGEGQLRLDDEVVELEPGTLVAIPAGVKHMGMGHFKCLVIGVPPFDPEDTFDAE